MFCANLKLKPEVRAGVLAVICLMRPAPVLKSVTGLRNAGRCGRAYAKSSDERSERSSFPVTSTGVRASND